MCRAIAAELGGDRVIYLADSAYDISIALDLVDQGLSFDEITSRLMLDFGPPHASIAAMEREVGRSKKGSYVTPEGVHVHVLEDKFQYSHDGYVIDDFADLADLAPA